MQFWLECTICMGIHWGNGTGLTITCTCTAHWLMLAVQNFASLGQSIKIYCIAGKIHGVQFRGWSMFTIFVDMGTHTHTYVSYNQAYFTDLNFAVGRPSMKTVKIRPLKNFPLYGSNQDLTTPIQSFDHS